jgi:hypothetical protein
MVHNPINTGSLIYRRADFLRFGLNEPAIAFIMEDYDSMLSLLENGYRGVVIPEPYFKYRIRSDSMFHTTTESIKIWTYQQLIQQHRALYTAYAEDILGLINCNGPGYMFDNPTLWYPALEYHVESGSLSTGQSYVNDLSQVSTKTLVYYTFRSILYKPYTKLRGKFPWLKMLSDRLKILLIRS